MRSHLLAALLCLSPLGGACRPSPASPPAAETAKSSPAEEAIVLVLWITVDQLRGDFLDRFAHHTSPEGFQRLTNEGAYYPNAHYTHAITETAPGHASLFTGAPPKAHGIVGNNWLDRDSGHEVASVADQRSPLVGTALPAPAAIQGGRSPRNLLLPTIGDALTAATAGEAKVVSISVKDRAAILPGGFSGKAFWLGPTGFITSRYYYETLPTWLSDYNAEQPLRRFENASWGLFQEPEHYRRRTQDDRSSERPPFGLGRTFPHPLVGGDLARVVAATPFGDELTVELALRAVAAEKLGSDDIPDLLAVSLSSTDTVGHAFGPESLEAEDNFVRLDRQLARLLRGIDERVGLHRTLLVLSSDHGGSEAAEHLQGLGLAGARIEPEQLVAEAREVAQRLFGEPGLVLGFTNPSLWVDHEAARRKGMDPRLVAEGIAQELKAHPDVLDAHAAAALLEGSAAALQQGGSHTEQVQRSIHPLRSGDIYIVPRPYALLLQARDIAATHGSPWRYDTHVPVLLRGPGVPAGIHHRAASPLELAATVARLLGITPPPGALPNPLSELL